MEKEWEHFSDAYCKAVLDVGLLKSRHSICNWVIKIKGTFIY